MKATSLKLLKIVHLIFGVVMWGGGALCMMLLVWLGVPGTESEMHDYAMVLKLIDDWLVTNGAIGCMLTGVIYSVFTKWGFIRHLWVVLKWLITIFMMVTGTFIMGPCVNANAALENLSDAVVVQTYADNLAVVELWGDIQMALLAVVVLISVFKPHIRKAK